MTFQGHLTKLKSKLNSGIYALSSCHLTVPLRVRKYIYTSLIESHLRFGAIIYGAANPRYLDQIGTSQRKAIRLVANSKFIAHTDPIFKSLGLLKLSDLIQLNQTIFLKQYSNKDVPDSLQGLFNKIHPDQQKCRNDAFNFENKQLNSEDLLHYPNVQLLRSYNRNSIVIKSERNISNLKDLFIREKLYNYEAECTKQNCYVCNNV
jgi:hypothetical protein